MPLMSLEPFFLRARSTCSGHFRPLKRTLGLFGKLTGFGMLHWLILGEGLLPLPEQCGQKALAGFLAGTERRYKVTEGETP